MHMQDGIGRAGYRMLAGVFSGLGLLGLGTTLYAFSPGGGDLFDWLGFGLSLVSFVVLFTLILTVLQKPARGRGPADATPDAAPAVRTFAPKPTAPPAPPASPQPVNFEFADATPAAKAAPTKMVLPSAFEAGPEVPVEPTAPKDPRDWPDRRPPGARKELAQRYTANAPVVRDIITASTNGAQLQVQARTVLARTLPNAEAPAPAGMGKGRCGGCATILVAPKARPINLRCPRCDKVTLLK